MIINDETADVIVCGDMERASFGIEANAKAYQILSSKIYTHKVRAVIRESACNAYDAHVAAGNPAPFYVHLPTSFEPWYSIRDYGISMDHKTCMELYSKYFHSTKTTSNDLVGCLGIGSKSPLCLVDSFNVTAFLDGEKRTYSVYNNEKGCPDIVLMGRTETDEPNGIEISMQVDGRVDEFQREAVEVFKYFDVLPDINESSVIDAIRQSQEGYDLETDDYKLSYSGYGLKAVMGNVAYNIPNEICDMRVRGIIKFNIGELDFDPGRENLSLDDKTVSAIKSKLRKVRSKLRGDIIKQIESKPNKFCKSLEYKKLLGSSIGTSAGIGGDEFFEKYDIPQCSTLMLRYDYSQYDTGVDKTETTNLQAGDNVLYFLKKPRMDRRVRSFIKDTTEFYNVVGDGADAHGRRRYVYFLTQEQIDELEIPKDFIKDPEVALPKITSNRRYYAKRSTVTKWSGSTLYSGSDWKDCEVEQDDVERVYVKINRYKVERYGNGVFDCVSTLNQAKFLCEDQGIDMPTVYGLKNAFMKTNGFKKCKWISLQDYLKRELDLDTPIPELVYNGHHLSLMNALADSDIPVDKIDEYSKLYDKYKEQNLYILNQLGQKTVKDTSLNDIVQYIVDKYPMLKMIESHKIWRTEYKQTLTEYVNQINQNGEI